MDLSPAVAKQIEEIKSKKSIALLQRDVAACTDGLRQRFSFPWRVENDKLSP
jgi:hypothetical protein